MAEPPQPYYPNFSLRLLTSVPCPLTSPKIQEAEQWEKLGRITVLFAANEMEDFGVILFISHLTYLSGIIY